MALFCLSCEINSIYVYNIRSTGKQFYEFLLLFYRHVDLRQTLNLNVGT